MIARTRSFVSLVVVFCALAALVCHGKVFLRHGTGDTAAGGSGLDKTGYSAAMTLNGGSGGMQILGFDGDYDSAVAELRATLFAGHEERLAAGDGLAFGIIRKEDRIIRVLVTQMNGKCILFRFEQSIEEFSRSRREASSTIMQGLPVYPGSVPLFSAGHKDTDTTIEISSANTDQETAWNFVDASLRQSGWTTIQKPGQLANQEADRVGLYVRNNSVCCAIVRKRSEREAESLISFLLHQRKNRNGEGMNEN